MCSIDLFCIFAMNKYSYMKKQFILKDTKYPQIWARQSESTLISITVDLFTPNFEDIFINN